MQLKVCVNCLLDTIARGLLLGLKGGECKGAITRAPRAVLSHAGRGCGLKGHWGCGLKGHWGCGLKGHWGCGLKGHWGCGLKGHWGLVGLREWV